VGGLDSSTPEILKVYTYYYPILDAIPSNSLQFVAGWLNSFQIHKP